MSTKTVESDNEGLKQSFMLTIPAADIEAKVDEEVKRIAPQVRMPGFRPGKVPTNLIRKMHGDALRTDALNSAVQEGVEKALNESGVRPAVRPEVSLDAYEPGKDAEVKVTVEALPRVPAPNIEGLKLERLTIKVDDKEIDQQLKAICAGTKRWADAPKKHGAEKGHLVVMDFEGKIGDKPFEGGTGQDMSVQIGSGRLIPGFEDQLVGAKAGDERDITVTFPSDYPSKNTRGKNAVFAVKVKSVKTASENAIDDELGKSLGFSDLEQLRDVIRSQMEQQLFELTRVHMKRQLLDQLAQRHDFPVPPGMIDAEYRNIRAHLEQEAQKEADPAAAMAEIERDSDEYRRIAERRVRLGLLLSEIGALNGITITDDEMNGIVANAAAQYSPNDRDTFIRFVQSDVNFQAQLRAPLYEDKVVEHLFTQAAITDRPGTREELEADLEAEEGHVHGPGCGHDHAAPAKGKAKTAKADKPTKTGKAEAPKPAKRVKDGAGAKPAAKAKADGKPAAKSKAETNPAAKAKSDAQPAAKSKPAAKAQPAAAKGGKKGK